MTVFFSVEFLSRQFSLKGYVYSEPKYENTINLRFTVPLFTVPLFTVPLFAVPRFTVGSLYRARFLSPEFR
jgi:hypothetical protein